MTLDHARATLDTEIRALLQVRDNLGPSFLDALDRLERCAGHVALCGVGKAGLVGRKISATLASTGTPSFFLHPAEALHGDLGMLRRGDVVVMLSYSGESEEMVRLAPHLRRLGADLIVVTGDKRSTLAGFADAALLLGAMVEACPLGLAPTATTTAMLALGDALAMALMRRRRFAADEYALRHPAGALGKKSQPVELVMRRGDNAAVAYPDQTVSQALFAITRARVGAAVIVDHDNRVLGIFCDGDLRRGLETDPAFLSARVGDAMVADCMRIPAGTLVGEVFDRLREKRIGEAPVVDADGRFLGLADLKTLVTAL